MLRPRYIPPEDIFPASPWAFEAVRYDAKLATQWVGQAETIFALSNGYLGLRGVVQEGTPLKEPGVFLNGVDEHRPISYGEHAHGFPLVGQSLLNCPQALPKLDVDDQPFVVPTAEVLSFGAPSTSRRAQNRDVRWATPAGKRLRLRTVRLVSFAHRHLAAIEYDLTSEDAEVEIVISSELENRQPLAADSSDPIGEGFVGRVLHPMGAQSDGLRAILSYRTQSCRSETRPRHGSVGHDGGLLHHR